MWSKLRFSYRLTKAFVRRYTQLILIGLIIGILGYWLIPRLAIYLPKTRKTQIIGIIGEYNQNTLPDKILKHVSLGLTQIDPQGRAYQGISSSWEIEKNGQKWTFNLDPQLTWSDSQPIKSSQLIYHFKDVNIEYPDDHQISFELKDPFSPFPTVLFSPLLRSDLIGIGPYKFSQIHQVGKYIQSIKLTPTNKSSTLPNLKYKFYGTEDSAKTAFKLGELDQIQNIINFDEFNNWPNITITQTEEPFKYIGLFFNLNNPNLSQKSSRQALAYAISDKSFSHKRIISPIMPESWAYNPHVKTYEYDLKRAKKVWGKFKLKEGSAIQISTVPSLLPIAEQIAKDWRNFGAPTDVKIINSIPEDYQVLLVTQEVPYDPDQYVLWHSTQPTNITHYQNPKVDKLLEDGRKTIDTKKRKDIYEEFQRTLLEDLPVLFLYRPVSYTVTRK